MQHKIQISVKFLFLLTLCFFAAEEVVGQTYKLIHSVGAVYDETVGTTIPDELKIPAGFDTYKTSKDDSRLATGVTLQRAHELERDVWCFPGESCELLPFSDFKGNMNGKYHVTYIRWFDYVNDANDTHLSFDNTLIASSNNKGVFGGRTLSNDGYGYRAMYASSSSTSDVLGIVGVDFAGNTFTQPSGSGTGISLTEPTLLWRHIYTIKNAKNRADEMMANNAQYIQKHKIKLMAPAGTPFQYRLDAYEPNTFGTTTKTGYYYKDGGGNYQPIYHYLIETYKDGTLVGTTIHKNGAYSNNSNSDLTYKDRVYTYKTNNDTERVLYMAQPTKGNYTIKVYAFGNTYKSGATVSDAIKYNGQPFQLMEYDLEIVDKSQGNMITEEDLKTNDAYKHQRPSEMEKLYGDPTTVVNFDKYAATALTGAASKAEINATIPAGDGRYYKWPLSWDQSSYGFGYERSIYPKSGGTHSSSRYDYNMYVLINHSFVAPYKTGVKDIDENYSDGINKGGVRYDRLYEDTRGTSNPQKGMMLFVNAAADPGRMAQLNVGKNFCTGTRVYVSAYISEFSNRGESSYEKANLAFSFKGVSADGKETTLSNFISGYITGAANTTTGYRDGGSNPNNGGKWMHVYYNFVPEIPSGSNFDHYIISLENNCVESASGADYAIDDIRAFVCKPEVKVFQDKPICNGQPFTELRFESNFDILMTALGQEELNTGSAETSFNYCFLDKGIYEKEMVGVTTVEGYHDAFDKALVKNVYNSTASGSTSYGKMVFNRNFTKNKEEENYDEDTDPDNKALRRTETSGDRTLVFPNTSDLNDEKMKVNNEYIMAIMREPGGTTIADKFDLTSPCAMTSNIKVLSSGQVKIDGTLQSNEDGISVCANQVPVITVDMTGVKAGGEQVTAEKAYFDWYMGPVDAPQTGESYTTYYSIEEDNQGHKLKTAMVNFRFENPDVTQDYFINHKTDVIKGSFTEEDYNCIKYFLDQKKIALYYQVDGINTFDRYNVKLEDSRAQKIYTTILPINPTPDDLTIVYCLDEFEVVMSISDKLPRMKNGDDQGKIPYPARMRDVPLRIGLKQLQKCTIPDMDATPTNFLYMPLRDVQPWTAAATDLDPRQIDKTSDLQTWSVIERSQDDLVYLLASNDPNVKTNASDDKSGALHAVGDGDVLIIGQESDITAHRDATGNVCHLAFLNSFKFREGYWYTVKFHFQENYSPGSGEVYDVCPGEVVFTIKVVPEYQKWTGAEDGNWNNEANWQRVSKDELLNPTSIGASYITNGTGDDANDNASCFVPADYTKVVIPAASEVANIPTLYGLRETDNNISVTFTGSGASSNYIKYMTLEDAQAAKTETQTALTNAQSDLELENAKDPKDDAKIAELEANIANLSTSITEITAAIAAIKDYATTIGAASDTINFDMSSKNLADGNIACQAWYDHTCDEIHFNSGAEMIGQQYLQYNKAWADVELEPGRWHTFSCPIKNVIAGDFYLPTDGARQETPLFEDINYKTALNDRFNPAVFQRSWNAQNAVIYQADGSTSDATESGIIPGSKIVLDWSHVYNDVNVRYEPGAGSSIKVDISKLPSAPTGGKVKFRFPKADTKYTYYYSEDVTSASGYNNVDIPADCLDGGNRTYKLIDITDNSYEQQIGGSDPTTTQGEEGVLNATDTKYFLVGNPFMCHLSMQKFFAENTGIEKKYWVVTEKGQRVVVMNKTTQAITGESQVTSGFISTDASEEGAEDKLIAPFQSFFVTLSGDAAKSFKPKFTTSMMVAGSTSSSNDPTNNGTNSKAYRSVSAPEGLLRVSAVDENNHESVMVLTDGNVRPTRGAEALFDTNLSDDPMIYSSVKGEAMSIAAMLPEDTVPIAVSGIKNEVTMKLRGVASFGMPLYLVDASTGESKLLEDDVTLKQQKNGVRYYLTSNIGKEENGLISSAPVLYADGLNLTVKVPTGKNIDDIHIFNTSGTRVAFAKNAGSQYDVTLAGGIYVVNIVCSGATYTYKITLFQ